MGCRLAFEVLPCIFAEQGANVVNCAVGVYVLKGIEQVAFFTVVEDFICSMIGVGLTVTGHKVASRSTHIELYCSGGWLQGKTTPAVDRI